MPSKNCESCLMPLAKDTDPRESEKYCSYCFKDGKFTYEGHDLQEFQRVCYNGMLTQGMNPWVAWFFAHMVRFAPRWRKQKN